MEKENNKKQNQESVISKWIFRIITTLLIMFFCYIVIHFEFSKLIKNSSSRESAERMINDIRRSIESLQDAWNTLYYFYQTGDLMKIIKCPISTKTQQSNNSDMLIMLYRDSITKNTSTNSQNEYNNHNNAKYVRCGGNITINIGLKNEIHKHPTENKKYTFKLGEEPLEVLEKFPFIKDALNYLKFEEKATFVAILAEKKAFKPKKHIIYELSIPNAPNTEITNLPLFIPINKNDNKFDVKNHITCGSVVQFLFNITDISGNHIISPNKMERIKIGSGSLNDDIEQVMTQMQIGDRYKIFLTKQMFKQTEILNTDIFKENDIVIVDLIIANVQK